MAAEVAAVDSADLAEADLGVAADSEAAERAAGGDAEGVLKHGNEA